MEKDKSSPKLESEQAPSPTDKNIESNAFSPPSQDSLSPTVKQSLFTKNSETSHKALLLNVETAQSNQHTRSPAAESPGTSQLSSSAAAEALPSTLRSPSPMRISGTSELSVSAAVETAQSSLHSPSPVLTATKTSQLSSPFAVETPQSSLLHSSSPTGEAPQTNQLSSPAAVETPQKSQHSPVQPVTVTVEIHRASEHVSSAVETSPTSYHSLFVNDERSQSSRLSSPPVTESSPSSQNSQFLTVETSLTDKKRQSTTSVQTDDFFPSNALHIKDKKTLTRSTISSPVSTTNLRKPTQMSTLVEETLSPPHRYSSYVSSTDLSDHKSTQEESETHEKQENMATEVLCEHAERFRMRLIRHFRLLENLNEMEIILETPKYHPVDILNDAIRLELLEHNPYALVKFASIPRKIGAITKQERRWRRIRCRETNYPPLDLWANWVVGSNWFQNIVLLVIFLNAIVLIVEGEISSRIYSDPSLVLAVQIIRTIDYCCLWIFVLEIFLKWIDDFKIFWKSGWNQLDFIVTVVSFLPDILQWLTRNSQVNTGSTLFATLGIFRVLRIIRLMKVVSRFEQARIILLSVSKAFSAMSFILLLLALFMWIFALMGQVIFARYTRFDGRESGIQLTYQKAFSNILWSFATLFQLMTLDHWLAVLKDLLRVMTDAYDSIVTILFLMGWIWIGSFVFKNIFAGIMVNNFQTIRNDLHWEKKEKEAKYEVDKFKKEITEGVLVGESLSLEQVKGGLAGRSVADLLENTKGEGDLEEGKLMTSVQAFKVPSGLSLISYLSNLTPQRDQLLPKDKFKKAKWENIVQRHMELTHMIPGEILWSRDILFRYFQTMELMQENLKERTEIIKLLNLAVLQLHDQ